VSASLLSTWGRPDTLLDHFSRHGGDFGFNDISDYAKGANDFFLNRNNYQIKTSDDGVIRLYDPKTNTFGSYNPDGTTKTFFKPDDRQEYFDRQPGIPPKSSDRDDDDPSGGTPSVPQTSPSKNNQQNSNFNQTINEIAQGTVIVGLFTLGILALLGETQYHLNRLYHIYSKKR